MAMWRLDYEVYDLDDRLVDQGSHPVECSSPEIALHRVEEWVLTHIGKLRPDLRGQDVQVLLHDIRSLDD